MTHPSVESLPMPDRASAEAVPSFEECALLRATLTRPLPEIPSVYFYDDLGSELFEQITLQPEYYHTRTEIGILEQSVAKIIAATRPRHVVELGSGAGRKIRLLLDAWRAAGLGETCTMLDVNELFVEQSLSSLRADYPGYQFRGVIGDFTKDLGLLGEGGERLTLFLGNTLGNFYPEARDRFFQNLAMGMAASDALLIGVDLIKDTARLEAAFNDRQGVTAAFNKSALRVLNQRFGADFDETAFAHRAFYDPERTWMEMRLRAEKAMRVHIAALEMTLDLPGGAEIRTEVSCRFTRASLAASAALGGLKISHWFTDIEGIFAVAVLQKDGS